MLYTTNKLELQKSTPQKIELNGNSTSEIMESMGNCLLNIIIITKTKNYNWYLSMLMLQYRFAKYVLHTPHFNIMPYIIKYSKSTGNDMVNIYNSHHINILNNNFIEIIKILFISDKNSQYSIARNKEINIKSFNNSTYNEQIDIVDSISTASQLINIKDIKFKLDNINESNHINVEKMIFCDFFKTIENIYNNYRDSYGLLKLCSIIKIIERIYQSTLLYYFSSFYSRYALLLLVLKDKFAHNILIDYNLNFNSANFNNEYFSNSSQIFTIILSISDIEINKKLLYLMEKINNKQIITEDKFIENIFDYDYYHMHGNHFNISRLELKKEKIPTIIKLINEKYNKHHSNNNCCKNYCNIM